MNPIIRIKTILLSEKINKNKSISKDLKMKANIKKTK